MKTRQNLPSPEEIRQACRQIRKTWNDRDYWRRSGYVEGPRWTVPLAPEPRFAIDAVRSE